MNLADVPFQEWPLDEVAQTLTRRFERQVELFPAKIAVRDEGGEVTYDQLNRLANRLAHALRAHSSQTGGRAAMLLPHGSSLIAAMLAVLKAGRIGVVLIPAHPEARLAGLIQDAGADVLIVDNARLGLARKFGAPVINLDELNATLSGKNPEVALPPQAPAFIIYTSGSTGEAKGVLQTHRNILHNIRRLTHGLHLNAQDRICLLASCSGGQGLATAFCSLLNGATLCPRDLSVESVAGLAEWLRREEITVYISAATIFRHFARTLTGAEKFPRLRILRLGSESITPGDLKLFQKYFGPDCTFFNTYSGTEMGNVCQFAWNTKTPWTDPVVPIGVPVPDLSVLLLDDHGQEVPPGEVGEIVVKSNYLSPGYWNDPELTRASFGEGIYHTRDLGRLRPDGRLEHMGRKDHQIKIRGYRISPEEIKSRLCKHPSVADALVEARADEFGNARLVACVIPARGKSPAARELRRFVREALPEYMTPSAFAFLEAFPRTANGKVDLTALRKVPLEKPAHDGAPPRNALEELLAGIWAEILNVDAVGIHDSFFDLGGDSLSVTQLACRIEEALGVEVSPAVLFKKPTVAAFRRTVRLKKKGLGLPAITRMPRSAPLPLSFAQERTWRYTQSREGAVGYVVSSAYVLEGKLDMEALQRSVDEIVRRHEPLRTTFLIFNHEPAQQISPAERVPMEKLNLEDSIDTEKEAERFCKKDLGTPVDLERRPLRVTLLRLQETRHQLVITMHHIAHDAVSREIIFRELALLYDAFSRGAPSPLPEPKVHYADFAVWHRNLLRRDGGHYRAQLAWWRKKFAKPPAPVALPCARPAAMETADIGEAQQFWKISAEVSRQLRTLAQQENATLFMTRLTAFAALLHRITEAREIVVGAAFSNRNRPETQEMVGFFSNLVLLRVPLHGNPSFRRLLRRVRKAAMETANQGDIPFEELRTDLAGEGIIVPEPKILFDVKIPHVATAMGTLSVQPLERPAEIMPWGFQFAVDGKGDHTAGYALFDARIYDPPAVKKILGQYEAILAEMAADPGKRLRPRRFWPFMFS